MIDRAAVVARLLLDEIIACAEDGRLRARLAERLREEFHDIQRQTLSEIRQEDE
jgi:hypothetical protein